MTPYKLTLCEGAEKAMAANARVCGLQIAPKSRTALYHLLNSLLTWSDVNGHDFDETLSCLRAELAEENPS